MMNVFLIDETWIVKFASVGSQITYKWKKKTKGEFPVLECLDSLMTITVFNSVKTKYRTISLFEYSIQNNTKIFFPKRKKKELFADDNLLCELLDWYSVRFFS